MNARAYAGHLLVDGYNIIHQRQDLRRVLADYGAEAALEQLAQRLRPIHDSENWRVTIVLDGRGNTPQIERPAKELTFSYVYTPTGVTADQLIEQLVMSAKEPLKLMVASRDNLLCETAAVGGAQTIRPDALLDWAQSALKRLRREVEQSNRRAQNRWRNTRNADMAPPE